MNIIPDGPSAARLHRFFFVGSPAARMRGNEVPWLRQPLDGIPTKSKRRMEVHFLGPHIK